jgi:hypothetical protein
MHNKSNFPWKLAGFEPGSSAPEADALLIVPRRLVFICFVYFHLFSRTFLFSLSRSPNLTVLHRFRGSILCSLFSAILAIFYQHSFSEPQLLPCICRYIRKLFIAGERLPPISTVTHVRIPAQEVQVLERLAKAVGGLHQLLPLLL